MSVGPMMGSAFAYSAAGSAWPKRPGSDVIRARGKTSWCNSAAWKRPSRPKTPRASARPTAKTIRPTSGMPTDGRPGFGPQSPGRCRRTKPAEEPAEEDPPDAGATDASDEPGGHLDLSG